MYTLKTKSSIPTTVPVIVLKERLCYQPQEVYFQKKMSKCLTLRKCKVMKSKSIPIQRNIKITGLDKAKGLISIYNIVGKLIEKTELSDNNQTFDLSAQPNGIYIMQIRIEDKISSWKIIKE